MIPAILLTLSCCCCFAPLPGESKGRLASGLRWQIEEAQSSKGRAAKQFELTVEIAAGERGDLAGDGRAVIAADVALQHLQKTFDNSIDSPRSWARVSDEKTTIHFLFPRGALQEILLAIASLIDGGELPQIPITTGRTSTSSIEVARRALIDALDPLPSLAPRGGDPYLRSRISSGEVESWRRRWHRPCRTLLRFRGPLSDRVLLDSLLPILGFLDPGEPLKMSTRRPLPATAIPFPPRLEEKQEPFLIGGWQLPAQSKKSGTLLEKLLSRLPAMPPPWPNPSFYSDSSPRVLILFEPILPGESPASTRERLVARLSGTIGGLDGSSVEFDSPSWQRLKRSLIPGRCLSIAVQRRIPLEQKRF